MLEHGDFFVDAWQPEGQPKYTRQWLQQEFAAGRTRELCLFWGHQPSEDGQLTKSCLSQWWGDSVLVEASPYDAIWGIRLAASSPESHDPMKWRGQNLLGFALMEVRDELRRVTQNEMRCDWSTVWQK